MVRRQLLCIVVPIQPASALHVQEMLQSTAFRQQLDDVFKATGCTHFSCMALLPPPQPRPGELPLPDLMIELTVDPDIVAEDLVDCILDNGLALAWALLDSCCPPEAANDKRSALRRLMLSHLSCADGGYVGCRDRTVQQIKAESELFIAARRVVRTFKRRVTGHGSSPPPSGRLARCAVDLTVNGGSFPFAATPSPRSFWRSRSMTPLRRYMLVALVLVVPAVLIFYVLMGALAVVGIAAVAAGSTVLSFSDVFQTRSVFGTFYPASALAVVSVIVALFVIETTAGLLRTRILSVTASLMVVFTMFAAFILVPFHVGGWTWLKDFMGAIGVLSIWGGVVLVLLAAMVLALGGLLAAALLASPPYLGGGFLTAVFLTLVVLASWVFHVVFVALVAASDQFPLQIQPLLALRKARPVLGFHPADAVLILLVLISILGAWIMRMWWLMLPRFRSVVESIDQPNLYEVRAAQQCDVSIDACESSLTGRVNHMISVTDVRDGTVWWRWMLQLFLRLITFLGESVFTEGRLGTASGIHFGHWHVIDNGRRLLFCSNFDGGFGGYLDEFIDGASQGINLFWRWTELNPRPPAAPGQPDVKRGRKYPPTRLLIFRGCKHEQWFKAFARESMVPHLYRFEAYPLTNQDIDRATRLRDALSGERTPQKDDQIMRAIES